MIAIPSARGLPQNRRKLISILGKVADDLGLLAAEAQSLVGASTKKAELSPQALQALARLAVAGRRQLAERLHALGADKAATSVLPAAASATINVFIQTYRRCGRRLCLAQAEAREVCDGQIADLVFHLLRDLERQLWLLDTGRGGVPFEATAAPALFQFC